MKSFSGFIALVLLAFPLTTCKNNQAKNAADLRLWYRQPAAVWEEALPVGNGRIGAMVSGDPRHEHLQLNEESIWAGCRINNNNPDALKSLPGLQKAIFENRFKDAFRIADEKFLGTPPNIRSYQPLGDLYIDYSWDTDPQNYSRELDLNAGITKTIFTIDGRRISEEVFASAPDNILVIHISSPDGMPVSACVKMSREKDAIVRSDGSSMLKLTGQIIDEDDPKSGPGGAHMKFAGELRISSGDGTITSENDILRVDKATEFLIRLTAATDYNIKELNFDRSLDPAEICKSILDKTEHETVKELYRNHLEEYKKIFDRVSLSFGSDSLSNVPTDKRLDALKAGSQDNGLIALYFQYGRYLLMSSSRKPAALPANLQGIWNRQLKAPWNSDFHTNINLQMNYWPAEVCNLSETSEVLVSFLEKLIVPGTVTAREMYGTGGWTIHHLTDPFGRTGVADGVWGITPMNGPWMTFPVYEHFLFTRDTTFLREKAYPMMKGSAEFVLGFLVESPEGYLVTNPSHSPENNFRDNKTGEVSALTYAATTDIEVVKALLENCIEASEILGTDQEFAGKLKETIKKLPPVKINSKGVIQEWINDYDEPEPGHRHMSHLLGLYPLAQFTPSAPDLFRAAGKTIERRLAFGGGHTGWSRAWIVSLYARLQDGEQSYKNLLALLGKSTLPNLFDTHPPFQIDGNFGGTAGIAEMLIQSHNNKIRLLPAVPNAWSIGEVKGLCARGGYVVDMNWDRNHLKTAKISSVKGGKCTILYKDKEQQISLNPGQNITLDF